MEKSRLRRLALGVLGVILLISLFFGWQLQSLRFDHSLEAFFPANDPETLFFDAYQEQFGSDNDFIMIAVRPAGHLFSQDFFQELSRFQDTLEQLPYVEEVLSPLNFPRWERQIFGNRLRKRKWIHPEDSARLVRDSLRLFSQPNAPASFFGTDRNAVLMLLFHQEDASEAMCREIDHALARAVERQDFQEVYTAGKCLNQTLYIELLEVEVILFMGLAVLMISLCLWLSYRNVYALLLPLLVVSLTVLWTVGSMLALNIPLDLISNILPVILLVIGVADVVHLMTHYLRQKKLQEDAWAAFVHACQRVGVATLLTSITTALGFLTLTTSSFQPLVLLGAFSALGVGIAFLLTYALTGILVLFYPIESEISHRYEEKWTQGLNRLYHWILARPRQLSLLSLVMLALALWGMSKLTVNSRILDDLRADHPHQLDFNFFGEQFGGVRPLHIAISPPDSMLFQLAYLREIDRLGDYLEGRHGVHNIISPTTMLKAAHQVFGRGRASAYHLPKTEERLEEVLFWMAQPKDFSTHYPWQGSNPVNGSLSGRIPDIGSAKAGKMEADIMRFIRDSLAVDPGHFRLTGTGHLMDLNNSFLANNVFYSLLLATLLIGIMFSLLMKNVRMVGISLLVNLWPLIMVGGIMGFVGIDIKISTSIIFIIAFGIAVDDSIHFLSHLRRSMKDQPLPQALKHSFLHTGKAILMTSMILLGGFLSLCASQFLGTMYVGLLISLCLGFAVMADLIFLPILIYLLHKSAFKDAGKSDEYLGN
ncbi:MAG: MMPL family transporter [Bacteroidota bacterium]